METPLSHVQLRTIQDISQKGKYCDISDVNLRGLMFIPLNSTPRQADCVSLLWGSCVAVAASHQTDLFIWDHKIILNYQIQTVYPPVSLHR